MDATYIPEMQAMLDMIDRNDADKGHDCMDNDLVIITERLREIKRTVGRGTSSKGSDTRHDENA